MTYKTLFQLLLLSLGLAACSTQSTLPTPQDTEPKANQESGQAETAPTDNTDDQSAMPVLNLDTDERSDLYYSILLASIADSRQVYDVARDNYLKAAQITGHPVYAKHAVLASERIKDFETSLLAAELWAEQTPEDLRATEITTIGYLRKDDVDSALKHFLQIVDKLQGDNEQSYRYLIRIFRTVRSPAAMKLLEQAVAERPKAAYLWLLLCQVALFQQEKPIGYQAVDQALALAPDFATAVKQKSHMLLIDKRVEEAETLILNQLKKNPNDRDLLIGAARLYYDLFEYQQAIDYSTQLLHLAPNDLEARYIAAISHHALKNWQAALTQFSYLIRFNYQKELALFYSGDIYEQLGDNNGALRYYESVGPGVLSARAAIRRADIIAKNGDPERGLLILESALAQTDNIDNVLLSKIEIINEHYGKEKALQAIDEILPKAENSFIYKWKKIWIYLINNEPDVALEYANKEIASLNTEQKRKEFTLTASAYFQQFNYSKQGIALLSKQVTKNPNDTDLRYSRALFSETIGDYATLENDLRFILSIDENNADAMNALGYTLVDLNKNLGEAESLIRKAYSKMPDNAAVIDSMGWLHFRKKDYKTAVTFLRRAARLEKSAEIVRHLAQALWYAGEKEKALDTLQDYLKMHPDDEKINKLLNELKTQ